VVAAEVARALACPLDFILIGEIHLPSDATAAIGAVTEGGRLSRDEAAVRRRGVSWTWIERERRRISRELAHKAAALRQGRPAVDLEGRSVILVDQALAAAERACPAHSLQVFRTAIDAAREAHPALVVVALPIVSRSILPEIAGLADEVVCVAAPRRFSSPSEGYEQLAPVSEALLRDCLAAAESRAS
jgi:predicted phosphoribosyltransferase